jgi:hypothetical protein
MALTQQKHTPPTSNIYNFGYTTNSRAKVVSGGGTGYANSIPITVVGLL